MGRSRGVRDSRKRHLEGHKYHNVYYYNYGYYNYGTPFNCYLLLRSPGEKTITLFYIGPPPLVVMITGGGVFTAGASHSLTCAASGGVTMTYTYQWLRYGGVIVGETSSTISFSPLREADAGRYNCQVTCAYMTITSHGVVINVEGECNGNTLIIT